MEALCATRASARSCSRSYKRDWRAACHTRFRIMDIRVVVAVVAAALAVASSQQVGRPDQDCPDPVQCLVNPCDSASCPRFDDAECRPNYCSGDCRAEFFRQNKDVTERCNNTEPAKSCADRKCSGNRVCVEEEVPCPDNRPADSCPDPPRVRVTCELIEQPQPATDCSLVVCTEPLTECVVRETKAGPRPRCESRPPRDCRELTCDDGMRCEERMRGRDNETVPRCVALNSQPRPRNCTQVTCREGMVCMLQGKRAKCVDLPPPSSCDELLCTTGYECRERGREEDTRAVCVELPEPRTRPPPQAAQSCEELNCPQGYQCMLREDRRNQFVPSCLPRQCPTPRRPGSCRELDCGEDSRCVVVGEGPERIARCRK